MLFLTEKRREGDYSTGDILFTSDSNNVNARFTSDYSVRRSGFTLDVQSIPCSDRENFPQHDDFNPHDVYSSTTSYPEYTEGNGNYSGNNGGCDESAEEVVIAARQLLQGAIVTDTENDGQYPNHACQNWNIIADENQVDIKLKKITLKYFVSMQTTLQEVVTKPSVLYSIA